MPLNILLVVATETEAEIFRKTGAIIETSSGFYAGESKIDVLVTGVGTVATAWAMSKWLSSNEKPDLAINAGIAGSFRDEIGIGQVVLPVSDFFGDAGIESGKEFLTLSEAGLYDPDRHPFRNGHIFAENRYVRQAMDKFPPVKAITLNTASGSRETIDRIKGKFNPDIETMEGAAFFYVCAQENIRFLAIRAISNRVEPRDRSRWNIPLALQNLSASFKEIMLIIK